MSISFLPTDIKSHNRKVVFDLFRKHGQLTRTAILSKTGISFPTVMKIVDFLLSRGVVIECGDAPDDGTPGRKGKLLQFNPEAYRAIGLLFEGRYACIGLVNMNGDLIEQQALNVLWNGGMPDLQEAADCVGDIITRNGASPILGIGIGFPGIIDPGTATVVQYGGLGVLEHRQFDELFPRFVQALPLPYYLENDVNLACVGELFRRGKDGDISNLVYLSLGTGLGGGIVLDGQLRRGEAGRAGEVGNVVLAAESDGTMRRLEQLVNLHGIHERFGVDINRAMPLDKTLCAQICETIGEPLAMLMANVATTLDVSDFVLAGVVPEMLGYELYYRINARLQAMQCPGVRVSPPVNPCPGITGGAITVFDNMLFDLLSGD